jgi:biotin transport system substrate-specific component
MSNTGPDHLSLPLVDRVWSVGVDRRLIRNIALAFAGVAVLTLSAKIKVPFYPVPMTMQTLAVLLVGAAYGWRLGAATVLLYIAHGVLGAPVFTNTPPAAAGPLYFMGPTTGFLVAFVASAAIAGAAVERGLARSLPMLAGAFLLAQTVVFLAGFLWLAFFATLASGAVGLGAAKTFAAAIQPFLLGDLLKTAIAVAVVAALARRS